MSAPVRLEAEFFDDPAVDALATILGYADRDTAAGKLARLFSWQTAKFTSDRPTYAVPRSILIGIFGARGPEAMIEAGLATLQADGLYKIHGSDKPNGRTPGKTRVNWLWLERQAQAERGRKRSDPAGDDARNRGRFTSAAPAADQPLTSRKHAADQPLTSSPDSGLRTHIPEPVISLSAGAREPCPPAPPHDVRTMAESFRSAVDRARTELQTELGVPFPGGSYADRKTEAEIGTVALGLVLAWIRSAPTHDPRAVVAERVAHLIAVRSAVARDRRKLDWWSPGNFWRADGIGKDLDHPTPAAAVEALAGRRPGHGARDSPPRHTAAAAVPGLLEEIRRLETEQATEGRT